MVHNLPETFNISDFDLFHSALLLNVLLQMASVWEERFKEEAEKTIPLQEVDF